MRPDRARHWQSLVEEKRLTVRGGGYSYAPAQVGRDSLHLDMRHWNHVLDFDRQSGRLLVEPGITLGEIHRLATPAGWHVPAQPGYPDITVGGCIAGDVHGKNQHNVGNFRHCVQSLDVWHPDHGERHLTPRSGAFELTVGGLGLTGAIVRAELQLAQLPSTRVLVTPIDIADARDTVRALHADPDSLFSYTWQDFTRRRHTGRGVAWSARYADDSGDVSQDQYTSLEPSDPGWPVACLTGSTVRLMNAGYGWTIRRTSHSHPIELFDFLFPAARRATYFKLFGKRGFHEAQILVRHEVAEDFLGSVAELARSRHAPVTLASCKLFAGTTSGIRFDGDGIVLAVDAPRGDDGSTFIAEVHRLMLEFGGRPNLLKDSLIDRQLAEASVDGIHEFRRLLREYDPARRFTSLLSERLGL